MQKITTCLWFNDQAEEAARFYTSLFKNSSVGQTVRYRESAAAASGQKAGTVMTVEFEIDGQTILALNGGPHFHFTPAFSYFVWCESESEIQNLWKNLSEGGSALMALDKYPWAEKYAFLADKFGVHWQLMLKKSPFKLAPAFLFVNKLLGRGEDALNFYMSLFAGSKIEFIARDEAAKTVQHCLFTLNGQPFVLMEGQGEHHFSFNEAFSLVANCDTQTEIDGLWKALSAHNESEQCGWLKDKFGVSWQIVPAALKEMLRSNDPRKLDAVMGEILRMKKLEIPRLEQAFKNAK